MSSFAGRGPEAEPLRCLARLRTRSKFKLAAATTLIVSDVISQQADYSTVRYKFDEPFDYFAHAGNFLDSLAVGYLAAAFVGKVASHLDASPRVVKTLVIGAGTLAAAFANTLAETKWGASWAFENSTPDHIDLAYGMAAGVLGASMVSVESVPVTE